MITLDDLPPEKHPRAPTMILLGEEAWSLAPTREEMHLPPAHSHRIARHPLARYDTTTRRNPNFFVGAECHGARSTDTQSREGSTATLPRNVRRRRVAAHRNRHGLGSGAHLAPRRQTAYRRA